MNFTYFSSSALAGTVVYKYDALGRVIEVVYSNGTRIIYTYDKAGNRTRVVKTI
ncbi:YD repeat protein [Cellvibrio sp. BR]|uniref:RHS repeat domain-containing protein n=1 Tax=Cellvibrio sp. BR TaxID=1134474 RepID=UPI0002600ADF|nr:YD repeat protein [Cellvibrio sp. BR]